MGSVRLAPMAARSAFATLDHLHDRYGPIARIGGGPQTYVCIFGPEAHQLVMADQVDAFRWGEALEPLVDYYRAISGEHPDWDDYRAAMVRQGKSLLRITVTGWGPIATGGFPPDVVDKL